MNYEGAIVVGGGYSENGGHWVQLRLVNGIEVMLYDGRVIVME